MALGKIFRSECERYSQFKNKISLERLSRNRNIFLPSILFLFSLVLINPVLKAQESLETSQSLELRIASLEQKYDTQIIQILSNYFDHQKFFVDVNIDAEMVSETFSTTQNRIVRERPKNVIMPGLPFLPEENLQANQQGQPSTEQVTNQSTVQMLRLNNISVRVFADSSFTNQEIDFMALIAGIAAKVDESRGDVISISQLKMPDFGFRSPTPKVELAEPEPESLFASLEQYIPGFILLLLVALTLLVSRFTGKNDSEIAYNRQTYRDNLRDSQTPLAPASSPLPFEEQHSYSKELPSGSEFDVLTDHFFKNPKEIALLFEYWMEEDLDSGTQKAAQIVKSIDPHILKSLKNELGNDKYQRIEEEIDQLSAIPLNKKKEIAQDFNVELQKEKQHSGSKKHTQLDLFKFLSHINEQQIVKLLEGEDRNTKALVIDYLPEDKAANVLDLLGQNKTAEIMLGMTNLNGLSYNQHRAVSSRLFGKAMDMLDKERELKSGADNILPILEKMPLENQRNYIEQLKAMGSPVGELIEDQFLTIDEIPSLDEDVIRDALQTVDTETLLAASLDFDQDIVDALFSVRPKREQRLLKMEIQQGSPVSKEEAKRSRNYIMRALRQSYNQYKGI